MAKDVVHLYSWILLSHENKWHNAICHNMDGPRDCHAQWSKSDREGDMSYHIPYVWNLKRNYRNELTKQKETHREPIYSWRGEGIVRKFGKDMDTLLYLRWITNKDLLYSTWNSAHCCETAWMWGGLGGEWMHVCIWLSPSTVYLKLS